VRKKKAASTLQTELGFFVFPVVRFSQARSFSLAQSPNKTGNILTRSKGFKLLVKKTFAVCDNDKTGEVGKAELYAGLLLVHLKLAKFAGPAACYVRTGIYNMRVVLVACHSGNHALEKETKPTNLCCSRSLIVLI
jgi:hypothetical protein